MGGGQGRSQVRRHIEQAGNVCRHTILALVLGSIEDDINHQDPCKYLRSRCAQYTSIERTQPKQSKQTTRQRLRDKMLSRMCRSKTTGSTTLRPRTTSQRGRPSGVRHLPGRKVRPSATTWSCPTAQRNNSTTCRETESNQDVVALFKMIRYITNNKKEREESVMTSKSQGSHLATTTRSLRRKHKLTPPTRTEAMPGTILLSTICI